MNTEILGVVVQIALMVILAYPLGKYIAKVDVYKRQVCVESLLKYGPLII